MNNFKRSVIFLGLNLTIIVMSASAAVASSYTSGPTGSQVNGVFRDSATLLFKLESIQNPPSTTTRSGGTYGYGSCDFPPYPCSFIPKQGTNTYKIYQNQYGDLYSSVNGSSAGKMGGWDIWEPTVYSVLYEGTITVDKNKPNVYLFNPPNNFNTDKPSIDVSGMADDEGDSGVDYVMVNSTKVSVNASGGFQMTLKLVNGLNTIEVYSVDKAGRNSSPAKSTVLANFSTTTTTTKPTQNTSQQQPTSSTTPTTNVSAQEQTTDSASKQTITEIEGKDDTTKARDYRLPIIILCSIIVIILVLNKLRIISFDFSKFRPKGKKKMKK